MAILLKSVDQGVRGDHEQLPFNNVVNWLGLIPYLISKIAPLTKQHNRFSGESKYPTQAAFNVQVIPIMSSAENVCFMNTEFIPW